MTETVESQPVITQALLVQLCVSSYPNETALLEDVKKAISIGIAKAGKAPRVLVMGALGRCGSGAVDLCLRAGVPDANVLKWDLAETAAGVHSRRSWRAICSLTASL